MRLLVETMLDLLQDFDLILWLGIEVARVIPLEMRLELTSCTPIGIAEMVVDHGIGRLEVDCPFEFLHRLVVAAGPQQGANRGVARANCPLPRT